ncbi:MAG: YncE family protein, partial [Hyalangium sp.]|uniref:YncE family protein n=1 Tax=Hyalangium sp. TaxID=2028555 RepID=UPI00389A5B0A
ISNIADCEDVLSVYDYSDVQNIQKVQTISAGSLGLACSLSAPLLPHGCATSKVSGHAYCNLTGSGSIVSVDLDATPPTAKVIPTGGRGGGFTQAYWDGRYLYSVQASPREGSATSPGAACQVGQLAVVDASSDSLAREVPLRYRGPDCTATLAGTDEAKAEVAHLVTGPGGNTLYVTLGAFNDADAHVRQELVVDLTQPAAPAQRASIALGPSNGSPADALSPDGRFLFVSNTTENGLSQIDTTTNTVVHTYSFFTAPKTMSLFSTASGPSEHVGPIH